MDDLSFLRSISCRARAMALGTSWLFTLPNGDSGVSFSHRSRTRCTTQFSSIRRLRPRQFQHCSRARIKVSNGDSWPFLRHFRRDFGQHTRCSRVQCTVDNLPFIFQVLSLSFALSFPRPRCHSPVLFNALYFPHEKGLQSNPT